jgi:hypothetical protein
VARPIPVPPPEMRATLPSLASIARGDFKDRRLREP